MDPDDAIQQLLKNTGWSCDDLLQRLQKIKHSTADDVTNEESTSQDKSAFLTEPISQYNSLIRKDSTAQEIVSKLKESNETKDSNVSSTNENVSKNIVPNVNIKCGETSDITKDLISSSTTDDKQLEGTFSDTDEEEELVNTTNTDIINEIIDDISTSDSPKPKPDNVLPTLEKLILPTNDKTEFTEVRVIEVDEEAEKSDSIKNNTINIDKGDIRNQPLTDEYETITIQTEPPEIDKKSEDNKKIEYVEIHPRKRYKLVEKRSISSGLTERPLPSNIKLIKRLPLSPPPLIASQRAPVHVGTSSNSPVLQKPATYVLKKKIIPSDGPISRKIVTNKFVEIRKVKQLPIQRVVKSDTYKNITISSTQETNVKNIDSGHKTVKESRETNERTNEKVENVTFINNEKASDLKRLLQTTIKKPTIPPLNNERTNEQVENVTFINNEKASDIKLFSPIAIKKPTIAPLNNERTNEQVEKLTFINNEKASDIKLFSPIAIKKPTKAPLNNERTNEQVEKLTFINNEKASDIKLFSPIAIKKPTIAPLNNERTNEKVEKLTFINNEKVSDIKFLLPTAIKKPTIPPFIKPISRLRKLLPKVETKEKKPCLHIKPYSQTNIKPSLLPANLASVSKNISEPVLSNSFLKVPPYVPVDALDFNTLLSTQKSELSTQPSNKLSDAVAIGKIVKTLPPVSEDSDEEINSSEIPSTKTLDELRNSLKLQLNSLRTRKKKTFLAIPSTQSIDNNMECSKKLSLLEAEESQIKISDGQDFSNQKSLDICEEVPTFSNTNETNQASPEKCLSDNELYTQTNELGLIILNVQGGVELDELDNEIMDTNTAEDAKDNTEDEDNSEEAEQNTEEIRVLDQLRNIINKSKIKNLEKSNSSSEIKLSTSTPTKIDEEKKMDISSLSGENSQSSEIEEKSPFVSDTLDEFLIESRLNISYQVPKLGAEDGLQKFSEPKTSPSKLILKKLVKEPPAQKIKSTTVIKAKTVAQKRRLLERERKKELKRLEKIKLKQNKLKPELEIKKEVKQMKEIEYKDKGYVLFKDNRIWVNSYCPNKCIARIDCTKEAKDPTLTPRSIQKKKWSLLYPKRKMDSKVRYRPGPLCQKQNLQVSGNEKWESHLLKLPELKLEVTPKVGQRFCDDVLHRFSSIMGGELDVNSIEFALSMVQTEPKEKPATFEFPLQFQNKVENVLVRRKRSLIAQSNIEIGEKFDTIKSSKDPVADVIEDLIRYIEIKELAPSLIKEDETHMKVEEKLDKLLSPVIENNVSVFKKPHRKRSKVEYELLRLNCKVVNVEVEETEQKKCNKPFCELGCLCKSLKCEYIATHHCQKVACMFECTCPKEKALIYDRLTLPPGTNVLSEDAVTRIEDEAKKNLAKVEREFTQTVIHTSNKTIVVGIGSRTKTRRSAKIPAKFTDFVPSTEISCDEEKLSSICHVSIANINLSQIIPYCLTHNVYDCYCKGKALETPISIPASKLSNNVSNEVITPTHKLALRPKAPKKYNYGGEEEVEVKPKMPKKDSLYTKYNEKMKIKEARTSSQINKIIDAKKSNIFKKQKPVYIPEKSSTPYKVETETSSSSSSQVDGETSSMSSKVDAETSSNSGDSWSPSKRPTRNIKKRTFSEDFVEYYENPTVHSECSRVKPIAKKYLKSYKYSSDVFNFDFIFNITDADLFKIRLQQTTPGNASTEAELLKQALVQEQMSEQLKQTQGKSKRKQTLSSRYDGDLHASNKAFIDAAIQRRKKVIRKSSEIGPVFEGEIIVDEQNMDLLKKMGPKTVAEGYARLLPWHALMDSFHNNTISIWSMVDQPSRLLINKVDKKCPKNYVNIKDTTQMTEVIVWILKDKLPSHYHEDSLSFILKETKDHFEICGICTKNVEQHQSKTKQVTPLMFKDEHEDEEKKSREKGEIFYHKDLHGIERTLMLYKENKFPPQDLKSIKIGDYLTQHLTVRLPKINNYLKWRMIYLNSDFTFLHFKSAQYSIRYTDLHVISGYANKNDGTVALINKELQNVYDHVLFGIYFDGKLCDRVFIGPYYINKDMDDDVETLRYINQTLISSESFNKMRGKGDYKCGHWLMQSNIKQKSCSKEEISNDTSTIDLTSETEEKLRTHSSFIIHNDEVIKIVDAPPRSPEDFNRYISTNIPYFGYLGAFTHPNGVIDVSWPFENKLLRFKSETCATSFLQDRFSSLLQCVPETFNINIIVSVKIDLSEKPINSCVLNGHYICGEFGYYNILTLTDNECLEKVGFTKEDVLKLFAKRAQTFIRKKIDELAEILMLPKPKSDIRDLSYIIDKANEEISKQTKFETSYMQRKKQLFFRKRENALKLHRIMLTLPPDQRNIENLKFREIVRKKEPIEVHDSDEEIRRFDQRNKIFKTPPPVTYSFKAGSKTKLKSVLKPLVSVPVSQSTSFLVRGQPPSSSEADPLTTNEPKSESTLIKGVKLVKTPKGYLIVSDGSKNEEQNKSVLAAGSKKNAIYNQQQDNADSGSSSIDVSASNLPSSDNSVPPLSNIISSNPSLVNILETNQSSSSINSSHVPSNSISVSRFKNNNIDKEDMYNIDETIIIDLDLDEEVGATSDNVTELHIMGDTIVKKVKDNLPNNESNLEISKYVATKCNISNNQKSDEREDVNEPTMVIDLDQMFEDALENNKGNIDESIATITKVTHKMLGEIINLDESEDDDIIEVKNKSPLMPEFVNVNDSFNDKMDYSDDMNIIIHSAEKTDVLESAEQTSEVCNQVENKDTDIVYIS